DAGHAKDLEHGRILKSDASKPGAIDPARTAGFTLHIPPASAAAPRTFMGSIRLVITLVAVLCLAAATGCTRVQPHVALPSLVLGEPSFFPTLEAYAGAPIVGGNAAEILLNGEHIFPAVLTSIRSARRTITYAQYYYEEGPVARDIAEAMAERCRAGVGVNILLDAFGSLAIPTEYLDLMRVSGCHLAWFRPLSQYVVRRYYQRNHRRILVVDGRVGFTGGAG